MSEINVGADMVLEEYIASKAWPGGALGCPLPHPFVSLLSKQPSTGGEKVWEAISVKSGMSSRLAIEKSIAMVEFIDW